MTVDSSGSGKNKVCFPLALAGGATDRRANARARRNPRVRGVK